MEEDRKFSIRRETVQFDRGHGRDGRLRIVGREIVRCILIGSRDVAHGLNNDITMQRRSSDLPEYVADPLDEASTDRTVIERNVIEYVLGKKNLVLRGQA